MFSLDNKDLVILIVLLACLAWIVFMRGRNRTAPLTPEQLKDLKRRGAVILDVRAPPEFAQGHAKGARNVPLGTLQDKLGSLDKGKPILTCCASGARSASARSILLKAGFTEVHNAGPWTNLES